MGCEKGSQMTIKTRILLLGLLAIASLLYILGTRFMADSREHDEKQALLVRMETAVKLSDLVHELQKERGISSGYLVNRSQKNEEMLNKQRAITNQESVRMDEESFRNLESLGKLSEVREKISLHQLTSVDSFGYYTLAILEILDQFNVLARDSNTSILKRDLHAHEHLMYAKEYLGEIRASLNESLSQGTIDKERVAMVSRLLALHQHHSRRFLRDTSPEVAAAFRAVLSQPRVKDMFKIVDAARHEQSKVATAEEWFSSASYAIDQLREVETQSMFHLRQHVKAEIAASNQRLLTNAALTLAVSLTLMFLAGSAVRRLLQALNLLVTNIEHTINTKDFSNRIQFVSNDEMGVISHSFNELLSIAEHMIMEKDYLASTDLLTGMYNRHKFSELFANELRREERYQDGLALIMLDIDHFKCINDDFGHAAGDMVLKEMAQLMRNSIRASDILARWGGEEFMILVLRDGHEAAAALAEKLRQAIEAHVFHCVPKITASFGVSKHAPGDSIETLCARADDALYRAKHDGRNRVCVEQEE